MFGKLSYFEECLLFLAALAAAALIIVGAYMLCAKMGIGPRMTVKATVKAKRTALGSSSEGNETAYFTLFFATFRTEEGETAELSVDRQEYEGLTVNTGGILTYKGNRMLSFEGK